LIYNRFNIAGYNTVEIKAGSNMDGRNADLQDHRVSAVDMTPARSAHFVSWISFSA